MLDRMIMSMLSNQRVVLACLIGLAIALLVVGVVSGTILRHLVQILPILLAIGIVMRQPTWGAYAAIPLFCFWIFIAVLIWLFLLDISTIASGNYTSIEVISTVGMVAFSLIGVIKSIRLGKALRPASRALAFIVFGVLQIGAMWISFLRPLATR